MDIKDLFEGIKTPKRFQSINLNDYPAINISVTREIEERVKTIIAALNDLKEYVDDNGKKDIQDIVDSISDKKINEINGIIDIINNLEINKKECDKAKLSKERVKEILYSSIQFFNTIWSIISNIKDVQITIKSPTINQLITLSSLLKHKPFHEQKSDNNTSEWNTLCDTIDNCKKNPKICCWITPIILILLLGISITIIIKFSISWETVINIDISDKVKWLHYVFVSVIVAEIIVAFLWAFNKYIQLQTKQYDATNKIKEKIANEMINEFREDREYSRMTNKAELALYEKVEKARIDEWCRNKEHERKLNLLEQERIADLNNVLKDMVKIKYTKTYKKSNNNQELLITDEKGILLNLFK